MLNGDHLTEAITSPRSLGLLKKTQTHGETREYECVVRQAHLPRRGTFAPFGVNVQGFKAPSKSLIWSPGIGRGSNPRPISVPASLKAAQLLTLNPAQKAGTPDERSLLLLRWLDSLKSWG